MPMQAAVGKPDYAVGSMAMQVNNQSNASQPSQNVMRGMIIRNANISLQVDNINSAMEKILSISGKLRRLRRQLQFNAR